MHLTRYRMYKRIYGSLNKPITGKVLGVSGIENFHNLINKEKSEIVDINYPDADMQDLPFKENSFDCVISDQVIEHLEDPAKAVRESFRVLKKGGMAIHTTCFMNYIHAAPKDFWRFSPDALRFLCRDFSEIIQCEGWGNRIAVFMCMAGDRFRNMQIPERKFSIMNFIANHNEQSYPIVTWVIARK